jgi:hypothetical protein
MFDSPSLAYVVLLLSLLCLLYSLGGEVEDEGLLSFILLTTAVG